MRDKLSKAAVIKDHLFFTTIEIRFDG